jgi:DNA polymerase III delta prime subunit
MSLTPTTLLKARESIENYSKAFESTLESIDTETLFHKVIGLEIQKRILMDAIKSKDPVHIILIGPPGNGKTLFLECIRDAFPQYSQFIDSTISSGIGMVERIYERANRLRFLLVDELEKFNTNDRTTLLGLLSSGTLSRNLKEIEDSYELTGLKIWFFATCNDIKKIKKYQKEFIDRCEIIKIPELDYETFLYVASKRLTKEDGIHSEEIARYIAIRVFSDFGEQTDLRRALRFARMSYARAIDMTEDDTITKDIVDAVASDVKAAGLQL